MNSIIQNILAVASVTMAVWFLLHKYGLLPKKKKATSKACGQDDCGCH